MPLSFQSILDTIADLMHHEDDIKKRVSIFIEIIKVLIVSFDDIQDKLHDH